MILDGNRRWAMRNRLPVVEAYRTGAQRVCELVEGCDSAGIRFVTVWALSEDNLLRVPQSVTDILVAVTAGLRKIACTHNWRIHLIGEISRLEPPFASILQSIADDTIHLRGGVLNVAVAYDGRTDITNAVRALVRRRCRIPYPRELTEQQIAVYLSTSDQPDIDLIIRTAGEQRLSGFMTWQAAYSELCFLDSLWPDFSRAELASALRSYAARDRRYGR